MAWFWLALLLIFLPFGLSAFFGAPYVPSRKKYLKEAFDDLYKLTKNDVLVDVGSGGGIVLREATARGASAVGYELNPILIAISRLLTRNNDRISIIFTDIWSSQLPDDTTVVYVFSVTRDMNKIIDKMHHESNRLQRSIYLINYGSELRGIKPIRRAGAYKLYVFRPLQSE